MNEILQLVLDKNKNRKILNESDIKRICEIIIGLNNYINIPQISFAKVSSEKACASTTPNEMTFYMENLKESLERSYNNLLLSEHLDGGKIDYYNYLILSIIFHEFAHVRQNDRVIKYNGDIEAKLFSICTQLPKIKWFYVANYNVFTTEVDAHARGLIQSYKIYGSIPKEFINDNDRKVYANMVMNNFLSKYNISSKEEHVKSPSEKLLESSTKLDVSKVGIDINDFRKLIVTPHNLTLYKKLLLGLPLTYGEASYIHMLEFCVSNGEKVNFIKKLQRKL